MKVALTTSKVRKSRVVAMPRPGSGGLSPKRTKCAPSPRGLMMVQPLRCLAVKR
jgi:hypothetical protein